MTTTTQPRAPVAYYAAVIASFVLSSLANRALDGAMMWLPRAVLVATVLGLASFAVLVHMRRTVPSLRAGITASVWTGALLFAAIMQHLVRAD